MSAQIFMIKSLTMCRATTIGLSLLVCVNLALAQQPNEDIPPPLFGDKDHFEEQWIILGFGSGITNTSPLAHLTSLLEGAKLYGWAPEQPELLTQEQLSLAGIGAIVGQNGIGGNVALQSTTMSKVGEYFNCWSITHDEFVPVLNKRLLASVRDRQPMPNQLDRNDQQTREAMAYFDAIIKANQTSTKAFLHAAKTQQEERPLTFANLVSESALHRGKIIYLTGTLRLVQQLEPANIEERTGIQHVYEAWLFNPEKLGNHAPVTLITPELPKGIPVGEDHNKTYKVGFVGYFFKMYAYRHRGGDGRKAKLAPLIVGRMLYLNAEKPKPTTEKESSFSKILPFIIGFAIIGVGFAAMLMWWTKKSDNQVRARVAAARAGAIVEEDSESQSDLPPSNDPEEYWSKGEKKPEAPPSPWDR